MRSAKSTTEMRTTASRMAKIFGWIAEKMSTHDWTLNRAMSMFLVDEMLKNREMPMICRTIP